MKYCRQPLLPAFWFGAGAPSCRRRATSCRRRSTSTRSPFASTLYIGSPPCGVTSVTLASPGPVQTVSIVLLFSQPRRSLSLLEVVLNIWRCQNNRSYFKNRLIGLGLIFVWGLLMLISITLTFETMNSLGCLQSPCRCYCCFSFTGCCPTVKSTCPDHHPAVGIGASMVILAGGEWTARRKSQP
jgi:hypothetical protein